VLLLQAVVEAVVALLEHRSGGAGVGAPRGVVVDPGPRPGRPDKDLQRVRAVMGVVAADQVPAFAAYLASLSRGRICDPRKASSFTRSARKRAARGSADPVGSSQMLHSSFGLLARDVVIGFSFCFGETTREPVTRPAPALSIPLS
jgi:hypothetical protein